MTEHYLEQRVFKRIDQITIALYRCLCRLETNQYAVQSLDFIRLPMDSARLFESESQFFELLSEISPMERCQWYMSLGEAIEAHDKEFSN